MLFLVFDTLPFFFAWGIEQSCCVLDKWEGFAHYVYFDIALININCVFFYSVMELFTIGIRGLAKSSTIQNA